MKQLTKNDRGTFLVTTVSGTEHLWELRESHGEVHVSVTRNPKGPSHFTMGGFPNGRPYTAIVHAWPEVGGVFLNSIDGGDVPWTRSSTIRSIECVA